MALAAELVTYVFEAFPNASALLEEILSKYADQIVLYAGFGLVALWEFIYDRLRERDPETIAITAASEMTAEASASSHQPVYVPNGYSAADKKILEQILDNETKEERKNQLRQYRRNGTFEDAKNDFDKLSGDAEQKKPRVWMKSLP
ncbi:unnamed protein product, partial [Rotaria sp. Silwood1]